MFYPYIYLKICTFIHAKSMPQSILMLFYAKMTYLLNFAR